MQKKKQRHENKTHKEKKQKTNKIKQRKGPIYITKEKIQIKKKIKATQKKKNKGS